MNNKYTNNVEINKGHKRAPYGTWKCFRCGKICNTRRELYDHNHTNHPFPEGSSWNKGLTKETSEKVREHADNLHKSYESGKLVNYNLGRKMPEEQRKNISESCKKFYKEHPELTPYKLHHSSKESFPEKYFRELFSKENITNYVQDMPVLGYFLDFGFGEKKIDLEIDGSQHWHDKRIAEHDIKRTEKLISNGWTVIRVRWDDW